MGLSPSVAIQTRVFTSSYHTVPYPYSDRGYKIKADARRSLTEVTALKPTRHEAPAAAGVGFRLIYCPSAHTHSDNIPCPCVSIKGEKISKGRFSHTQCLQNILRQHSTNNSADGCKLMNRRRDGRPVRMVVGYVTNPNKE